jgi:PBP1b-binding outer membrane lipoprotein LpoB
MKKLIAVLMLIMFFASCEKIPYEPQQPSDPAEVPIYDSTKIINMNLKWC